VFSEQWSFISQGPRLGGLIKISVSIPVIKP
jgi:hypothetical protein